MSKIFNDTLEPQAVVLKALRHRDARTTLPIYRRLLGDEQHAHARLPVIGTLKTRSPARRSSQV